MTLIRNALGFVVLALVYLTSRLCMWLISVSAWLLDREDHEKQVREFMEQREIDHPIPQFEDNDG